MTNDIPKKEGVTDEKNIYLLRNIVHDFRENAGG